MRENEISKKERRGEEDSDYLIFLYVNLKQQTKNSKGPRTFSFLFLCLSNI